jgi:hypothetical protein
MEELSNKIQFFIAIHPLKGVKRIVAICSFIWLIITKGGITFIEASMINTI